MSELYTEDVFDLSGSRCQQLCVKLEPRGLLYIKLSLQEKWDTQVHNPTAAADTCSTGHLGGVTSSCSYGLFSKYHNSKTLNIVTTYIMVKVSFHIFFTHKVKYLKPFLLFSFW